MSKSRWSGRHLLSWLRHKLVVAGHELGFLRGKYSIPRSLYRAVRPSTLLSLKRLDTLYFLTMELERREIPGCVVECGVYKGGSAGVVASALLSKASGRIIHLFDSFEGLPQPSERDGEAAKGYAEGKAQGELSPIGRCVGREEEVADFLFGKLGARPANIKFHKGWFQHTLPSWTGGEDVALLHVDCDWYESVKLCLSKFLPRMARGGYVVLDDYHYWQGCRQAVEDFFSERGSPLPLIRTIDDVGAYFEVA